MSYVKLVDYDSESDVGDEGSVTIPNSNSPYEDVSSEPIDRYRSNKATSRNMGFQNRRVNIVSKVIHDASLKSPSLTLIGPSRSSPKQLTQHFQSVTDVHGVDKDHLSLNDGEPTVSARNDREKTVGDEPVSDLAPSQAAALTDKPEVKEILVSIDEFFDRATEKKPSTGCVKGIESLPDSGCSFLSSIDKTFPPTNPLISRPVGVAKPILRAEIGEIPLPEGDMPVVFGRGRRGVLANEYDYASSAGQFYGGRGNGDIVGGRPFYKPFLPRRGGLFGNSPSFPCAPSCPHPPSCPPPPPPPHMLTQYFEDTGYFNWSPPPPPPPPPTGPPPGRYQALESPSALGSSYSPSYPEFIFHSTPNQQSSSRHQSPHPLYTRDDDEERYVPLRRSDTPINATGQIGKREHNSNPAYRRSGSVIDDHDEDKLGLASRPCKRLAFNSSYGSYHNTTVSANNDEVADSNKLADSLQHRSSLGQEAGPCEKSPRLSFGNSASHSVQQQIDRSIAGKGGNHGPSIESKNKITDLLDQWKAKHCKDGNANNARRTPSASSFGAKLSTHRYHEPGAHPAK